jgi:hypothetical protein
MRNSFSLTSRIASGAALVAVSACGIATQYVPLNPSPHPMVPRLPADVQVFADNRPTRSFTEVGMIEVQEEFRSSSTAAGLLTAIRDEASRQGCEAIVLQGANDAISGAATRKGYRAICVVFNDEPTSQPAAVQDPHIGPTL